MVCRTWSATAYTVIKHNAFTPHLTSIITTSSPTTPIFQTSKYTVDGERFTIQHKTLRFVGVAILHIIKSSTTAIGLGADATIIGAIRQTDIFYFCTATYLLTHSIKYGGISSVGRALALHARGQRFKSVILHYFIYRKKHNH